MNGPLNLISPLSMQDAVFSVEQQNLFNRSKHAVRMTSWFGSEILLEFVYRLRKTNTTSMAFNCITSSSITQLWKLKLRYLNKEPLVFYVKVAWCIVSKHVKGSIRKLFSDHSDGWLVNEVRTKVSIFLYFYISTYHPHLQGEVGSNMRLVLPNSFFWHK